MTRGCQEEGRPESTLVRGSEWSSGAWSRANMAHIRQSRQDFSLGLEIPILNTFQIVPSSLGLGFIFVY